MSTNRDCGCGETANPRTDSALELLGKLGEEIARMPSEDLFDLPVGRVRQAFQNVYDIAAGMLGRGNVAKPILMQQEIGGIVDRPSPQDAASEIPMWLQSLMQWMRPDQWIPIYVNWATNYSHQYLVASPTERFQATEAFFHFLSGLGYGFGSDRTPFGFGTSQVAFTNWEVLRGVLNDPEELRPGSPWWRAVNGQLLGDMKLAQLLHQVDISNSDSVSVKAWLDYLNRPSPEAWYLAHNISIIRAYSDHSTLIEQEDFAEQLLASDVLVRVVFAQVMVTSDSDDRLDNAFLKAALQSFRLPLSPQTLESLIAGMADPRGSAVEAITRIDQIYPRRYPLALEDYWNIIRIHDLQSAMNFTTLPYGAVDSQSIEQFRTAINRIASAQNELRTAREANKTLLIGILPYPQLKTVEERIIEYEMAIQIYEEVLSSYSKFLGPTVLEELQTQLDEAKEELEKLKSTVA